MIALGGAEASAVTRELTVTQGREGRDGRCAGQLRRRVIRLAGGTRHSSTDRPTLGQSSRQIKPINRSTSGTGRQSNTERRRDLQESSMWTPAA